ncbi:MAG: heat-inducible transcriptional repressor HrcA [Ilumatobacteraceae bacterium]|nr:MAG: heat-inducible transcription repressor HrcA [Actinomycetota bacterium]
MLDERKTSILRAVVQEYIGSGQPVGSTHVAAAPGVKVSSATVRNEMAVLEQEGYLVQPHTSAGRVPTDKGYRFFVDHLTQPGRLDEPSVQQVREFFDTAHGRLEEMLARTSHLVAGLTSYASVVLGPAHEAAVVRSVQVVGLSARLAMVVAVMSNGSVESDQIELEDDVGDARLAAATAHLQQALAGCALADLPAVPSTGDFAVDMISARAVAALGHCLDEGDHVYVGGASAMASAFDAVAVVRQVLQTLEQQYVVVSLVRDVLDRGLSVAIGAEHGVEPLAACSVVVAPVVVDGEQLGTVGVLGPTRMNYPQALATVDVVSERLAQRLAEG